jgi:SAM-dependent methyltransferase
VISPDAAQAKNTDSPSLEALVESGLVATESLHPGGLGMSLELASLCELGSDTHVLDVACGTGATACELTERMGAHVCGLDQSALLLDRARANAHARRLAVEWVEGDALALPFADGVFDAVLSECTLCLLDKVKALQEMTRVVRPGGFVGMHDLYWRTSARESLKARLARIEGEEPETLDGWQALFSRAGLSDVRSFDRSALKTQWLRDPRRQIGLTGQLRLARQATSRWGLTGLWTVLRSQQVMSSEDLGYGIVIGVRAG